MAILGIPSRPVINNAVSQGYYWDPNTLTWKPAQQPSGGAGGSGPVTIADGANIVEGFLADAAITSDVNGTLSGKLRGLVKIVASVWDSVNGRLKVDGSGVTQPVSAASLPLPTGAAKETGGNLDSIKADVDKIPSQGQSVMATSMPVVIASNQSALSTTWNGTAPPIGGGVEATALRVTLATDSTGQVKLALSTAEIGNIKNSGTFAVQATLAAETTKVIGTVNVASGQSIQANAGTNLNTSALALEAGNLASVKTSTDPFVASTAGGYIRQDSTNTIAKETGGNLASVKTNTDSLVTAAAGGYVRQDSTGTIAKETGGNLATVKTNTDPLVVAAAGGYVRQDSTATIAKESGGNLAASATSLASIDTKLTSPLTVISNKTHNAGVPGATNAGVLPAIATAATPSYTEGNQVSLSTDLSGNIRVSSTPGYPYLDYSIPGNFFFEVPDLTSSKDPWSIGAAYQLF